MSLQVPFLLNDEILVNSVGFQLNQGCSPLPFLVLRGIHRAKPPTGTGGEGRTSGPQLSSSIPVDTCILIWCPLVGTMQTQPPHSDLEASPSLYLSLTSCLAPLHVHRKCSAPLLCHSRWGARKRTYLKPFLLHIPIMPNAGGGGVPSLSSMENKRFSRILEPFWGSVSHPTAASLKGALLLQHLSSSSTGSIILLGTDVGRETVSD